MDRRFGLLLLLFLIIGVGGVSAAGVVRAARLVFGRNRESDTVPAAPFPAP